MPKYTPTEDDMGMGDDMTSMYRSPGSEDQSPQSEEQAAPKSVDEANQTGTTAIIPNKVLSPDGEAINEGDEIVVQVVKNYGDESEVKYAPKKGGDEATGSYDESAEKTRDELTSLSGEGE